MTTLARHLAHAPITRKPWWLVFALLAGTILAALAFPAANTVWVNFKGWTMRLSAPEPSITAQGFRSWTPSPPMGWNSWDCFGAAVTESQVKAQADYMARNLRQHGWDHVVVDIQWYEPEAVGHDYREQAELTMDEFGRLLPAVNRFPSAADGTGFRALGEYVHARGLKFGVHLMRGIPRQAVARNTAILGTGFRAAEIADRNRICPWNSDMFGVDVSKPGAQAYYDSVVALLAEWGVDFVKLDDMSHPHAGPDGAYHAGEAEAFRRAIDRVGRPIVLSFSPGKVPMYAASHVSSLANMWRTGEDLWDEWPGVRDRFTMFRQWSNYSGDGTFSDGDMLPLGVIRIDQPTRLTRNEQVTLMTLWCIARSPLMFGGDLTQLDDFTHSLLTNDEVISVNQSSRGNRQVLRNTDSVVWAADVPGSNELYVALFNLRDPASHADGDGEPVRLTFAQLGGSSEGYEVRDLWLGSDLGLFQNHLALVVPRHGARLLRLKPMTRL